MQTVEAIQISASRAPTDFPQNEFPADDGPLLSGLEELAHGSLGNGDKYVPPRGTTGFQALIKRVVELTTELSSQVCVKYLSCVLSVLLLTLLFKKMFL